MTKKKQPKYSIKALEEIFFDQLQFKFEALLKFRNIQKANKKEMLSYLDNLKELTKENIEHISLKEK
jgi:hypothetical protein